MQLSKNNLANNPASILTTSLASLAFVATAHGAITSVSGQAVQIAAPTSAVYTALPGPPAYCWDEQQGVSSSALLVNTIGPGTFTGGSWGPSLAAGVFDSHMIHFDAGQGVAVVQGSVSFSGTIIAVIYENNLLDISDGLLGAPGTTYATGDPFRSHSSALGASSYTVAGNTISFTLWANSIAAWPNNMAQLRVLTDSVPAPGAVALLGLAGFVGRRRR
jgi:MYXO-CTERM domain-containing protein